MNLVDYYTYTININHSNGSISDSWWAANYLRFIYHSVVKFHITLFASNIVNIYYIMVAAIIGASPTLSWSMGTCASTDRPMTDRPMTDRPMTDRPTTDRPCPSQSHDIDMLILIHCTCPRCHVHVRGEQWTVTREAENADDGKAKSRGDTRTTKCKAGKRERPAKTKESTGDRGRMGG